MNEYVIQKSYQAATGMKLSKFYTYSTSEVRTYDAFNRFATICDARGVVKTHTYDVARGLMLSESYSDETNNRTYVCNFLAMPVQISDDAGVKNLVYNSFNELEIREGCTPSYNSFPCLWLITWDPTQPVATRPLAIQKDGTWFCYGWDLTKNICEVFGPSGYIRSTYTYTPFGSVTASGDVEQPIQWSSEYCDSELALVYYNYRHYNPTDGRWINRDPIAEQGGRNLYGFVRNSIFLVDDLGKRPDGFYDLSLSIGALDRETLNKLKNVINELNKLKDKCYRRCYDVTLNVKPITKEELFNFSIKYDLVILMTHSEGFPDEFYIQIKDGEKLHSNDIPKNVKAYGCHLAGKREFYYKGRKFYANPGNRKNPMGQLYLMIQMIEYLESLKMKAECKTIFKIVLLTTVR